MPAASTPTLDALRAVTTLRQLAPLLALKPAVLAMQLYKKDKRTAWYTSFSIPKRHGGERVIHAPEPHLKMLQRRLSDILIRCESEINALKGFEERPERWGLSHAFRPNHSIVTNARCHVGKRFVFNADLTNFFGSIHFGRVRGFFQKNGYFSLHPKIAEILAHIACYQGGLPQGSPCSPVISNLIAHPMDVQLADLAMKCGAVYSRYADDLSFSSNKRDFPDAIATQVSPHVWVPGAEFARVIRRNSFSFNEKKTRMQYCDSRQEVTGLTVNRKVNVTTSYRMTTRAMVHRLFETGEFSFDFRVKQSDGTSLLVKKPGKMRQLLGRLMHIHYLDQFNLRLFEENGVSACILPRARNELLRKFLYFFYFYRASEPVLVCEGKTDNVYLRCAIKSRAALFPSLALPLPLPILKVRLFKYSDRRSSLVTDISGGVGGICKMIKHYHNDVLKWRAPAPKHPVIVVIDNDKGADSIYEAIAGITKKPKPKGFAPFIRVTSNLYVVPTPPIGRRRKTEIEDFFDATILGTTLGGKRFSRKKDVDTAVEYGKAAFALNVVAKNSDGIDFSGFDPLLARIAAAIADYG